MPTQGKVIGVYTLAAAATAAPDPWPPLHTGHPSIERTIPAMWSDVHG